MKLTLMARALQRGIIDNSMYVPNAITNNVDSKQLLDRYLRLPMPGDDSMVLTNMPFDREAYLRKIAEYNNRNR